MSSPTLPSQSHLVIIPSYNSGPKLSETVCAALRYWQPVWVVIDGSTDDSARVLESLRQEQSHLNVLRLPDNQGKGAAVLHAMKAAQAQGFEYALVMDSDGQHPAEKIPQFMEISRQNLGTMVLGVPKFGSDAPASREQGRRVGNWWANLETLWGGINDSLFGFRVYPINASLEALSKLKSGRRYDFDTQLAVRLFWKGVPPINVPVPVRYFSPAQGGVSHFHYLRDNLLLIRAHTGLVLQMPWRMTRLRIKKQSAKSQSSK
jgi:glycosyltransferase involved in cell wall biosynthesis